jgi:hypothetical protein
MGICDEVLYPLHPPACFCNKTIKSLVRKAILRQWLFKYAGITDGQETEMESRELAAGMDGDSGAGTGADGVVTRWRGRAWWKM